MSFYQKNCSVGRCDFCRLWLKRYTFLEGLYCADCIAEIKMADDNSGGGCEGDSRQEASGHQRTERSATALPSARPSLGEQLEWRELF